MNKQAKQIIGILEDKKKAVITFNHKDDVVINEYFEGWFYGRRLRRLGEELLWFEARFDFHAVNSCEDIYPLPEKKEEEKECDMMFIENLQKNHRHLVKNSPQDRRLVSSLCGIAEEVRQTFELNNKEELLKRVFLNFSNVRNNLKKAKYVIINGINFLI